MFDGSLPEIADLASLSAMSAWGSGEAGKALLPSVRSIRLLAMVERMSASPGMARVAFEALFRIDVRPILPTITAPTLVIHARDEIVPVQCGRDIADHIPGARMLEVDGSDHAPWLADPDRILTVVEEFLTGSQAAPPPSRRALRAVLFTDIVGSTQHAAAAGDERWRAVLQRFDEITAEQTQRFGGTVVESTGDGHLITFDGPTHAIRCAEALRTEAETLGVELRAGIHTGEILVSRTVCDLVVGSGTGFVDRGNVELLRGLPGTWQLLAVDRHGPRGRISRGATGGDAHPQPSGHDAPLGPRSRADGAADTVDPARNGPPRPDRRRQMSCTAAVQELTLDVL